MRRKPQENAMTSEDLALYALAIEVCDVCFDDDLSEDERFDKDA
jgi:hypothetical protein